MIKAPALWGASLACALGGAIAGNALGSTPPLDRSVLTDFYQSHAMADGIASQRQRPPDHYPLVTAAGVVPVGELSMRGLYSQARYLPRVYPAHSGASEVYVADYVPGEEWRPETGAAAFEADEPPPPQDAARLQVAALPSSQPSEGEAKMLDVNAALAMR